MEIKSEKSLKSASSSAAAPIHKLYSAQEIGDLMNTKPLELLNMNIGFLTRWYNCEFIEEILRHVEKEPDIQILMTLIVVKWHRQVDEHNLNVCHYDPTSRAWIPYADNLQDKLNVVFERVKAYRKHKAEEQQMEKQWRMLFGGDGQHAALSKEPDVSTCECGTERYSIQIASQISTDIEYHLDDLPEDVRNHIQIADDKLYSDFVATLKGPVKLWIDKHNLKDWNVVRFICRIRGIVSRNCSLRIFGKFLEKIGLGNQENNMKQRQDANNNSFLKDYDDPKKKQNFWKLKRDGDAIEKELNPIIEQLSA